MKTLKFQRIVESIKESKSVYSINDFDRCYIWAIRNDNLDAVNSEIRRSGLFRQGVKVLQPVILPPKDALDEAAKKIASETPNITDAQTKLSQWPSFNYRQLLPVLTKDYSKELTTDGIAGISYRLARAFIEKYTCGILVAPIELNTQQFTEFTKQWYQAFHRIKMHKDMYNIGGRDPFQEAFIYFNNLVNIKEYKVYTGYNVDQDVEDAWGRALNVL